MNNKKSTIQITLDDGRDITHTHSNVDEVSECLDYLKTIGKSEKDVAWVSFDRPDDKSA